MSFIWKRNLWYSSVFKWTIIHYWIRSLDKCYKKQEKALLDITLLKNCRTFNAFPKVIHVNVPFSNRYDVTYINKRLLKIVLHKCNKEKKMLDAELTSKTQHIRSRCDGITCFVIYKLIQRNVKKAEKKSSKHTWRSYMI